MKTNLSNIILFTLLALPMLLPFATFLPLGNSGYEIAKMALLLLVLVGIVSVIVFKKMLTASAIKIMVRIPVSLVFLIWICWNFICSLINGSILNSFWGDPWYGFGLLALIFLYVYFNLLIHFIKHEYLPIILAGFATVGFVQTYVILMSSPLLLATRSATTLGEPNWLGSILMVSFVCAFSLVQILKRPHIYVRFSIMISIAIVLGILSTGSRSSMLATLIAFIFIKILSIKKINKTIVFWAMILLLLIGNLGAITTGYFADSLIVELNKSKISSVRGVGGTDSRLWIYEKGVALFLQKPLTGWGWEQIDSVYKQPTTNTMFGLENLTLPRSHNLILDLLIGGGIISAGLFSLFMIWILKIGIQNLQSSPFILGPVIGVFGLLIYAMINPFSISHWVILIFFSGVIVKVSVSQK